MSASRKNKIQLSDYNYRRDIENRQLMAEVSSFELEVLREIIDGSLKFPAEQLAETLETPLSKLLPILQKFSKTKLYQIQPNNSIVVDKEMRKYFGFLLEKFDEDFEPGMEFLQCLLSKIPIHSLPAWYSISRTADNIFCSILEKYMLTPKIYERYLSELTFDEPILKDIMKDVFSAKDFIIESHHLMQKYSLTRERLEELLLLLEFNFVCCLSYQRRGDNWIEVVTPFAEWRAHLEFINSTMPKPIENKDAIRRWHKHDFGFMMDLNAILKWIQKKPLPIQSDGKNHVISEKDKGAIFSGSDTQEMTQKLFTRLINKALIMNLAELKDGKLIASNSTSEWLKKSYQDQALTMYRLPLLCLPANEFCDRDVRESEKSLKRVLNSGWIYYDDFLKGMLAPLGNSEQTLVKKGKRWRYTVPSYSEKELAVIHGTILERLWALGMVAAGTHDGRVCFCVTPFGRMSLED